MPTDVVMPRLSDSMEEGTILSWIASEGEEISVGDELVEIETDKANMVYESDASGTLIEIVASEGDTLPIGEVIARVGDPSEAPAEDRDAEGAEARAARSGPRSAAEAARGGPSAPPEPGPEAGAGEGPAEAPVEQEAARGGPSAPSASGGNGRVRASPLARRIARENGVEISALQGSGPGGRIIKADVEQALAAGPPAEAPERPEEPAPARAEAPGALAPGARERPETAKGQAESVELSKLQSTIARRMAESKATAPHFYLSTEIDMDRAVAARARIRSAAGSEEVVPSFNDMIVKACALALRRHPRANGAYRDGKVELYSRVNVGVAVAAREALVVPTVFDADRKGLREIASEARSLAQRVRDGSITPPELSGATFTVSNLGMYGITEFAAVINPPQAGILAVGEVSEQPVVREGEIVPGHRMKVNLACDHRILYGADGAELLATVRKLLEEPVGLAL